MGFPDANALSNDLKITEHGVKVTQLSNISDPFSTSYKKETKVSDAGYVVPAGRVVVPTGRYVVPAGKVIIIVSPGRLSLVPTGRILSPGKVK
ncbi:hypothetical protein Tco_0548653 [Tanacetum coccineum]